MNGGGPDIEFGGAGGVFGNHGGHEYALPTNNMKTSHAYARQIDVQTPFLVISAVGALLLLFTSDFRPIMLVLTICGYGALFSLYLSNWVLAKDDGTPEMRDVSNPIREGAEGFLRIQYTAISRIAVAIAGLIFFSYALRPSSALASGVETLGNMTLGILGSMSFLIGAVCSAAAGYISMWVSAQSNIRVASAARRSYGEALLICFRGGAFSAVLDITLCVSGVSILYVSLHMMFGSYVALTDIPMLMVGYGFGASFVALFMQLGGGIYTKAADVGADLVGKVEVGIPEDDPRNPAVIADLSTQYYTDYAYYPVRSIAKATMNNYGPIADNAGGIAEMSRQPDYVRDATDKLDAAGNVTKAITKGYSIGSAALACFVLFGAFMDEFSEFAGREFKSVDIATVEVLVGGLLGTMMVFFFTGLAVAAVGDTASEVVNEVRRQFEMFPGIMEYKEKPDYRTCVALVTKAALKQMRFPGLLAVLLPVTIGLVFRVIGEYQNKPLLGAEVLAGYLMFGTVTGIMMALFLDNVGGAWDNAKKYVELGNFGGKGSEAHKAAVTGDTVAQRNAVVGMARANHTHAPLTLLTEEEEMFKDTVAKFAADMVLPRVQAMDQSGEMDHDITKGLFDNGFLSIEIPADYGGSEASFMSLCITIEELSKVDPVVGLLVDLQNTVVNNVFLLHGSEEQKEKYLPRLSTDMIGSFCLSEAGSGSDAFALKTRAEVSSDGSYYTLNGQKMWISNAEYAGVFLVFANVDPSKGYKGITCFIVDRDTEGLEVGKPEDKLGIRASSTCPVSLNNVKVKKENIMGEVGKGYKIAISTLNEGRIGIASQMLGLAQGVYDQTLPYLFDRHQFGSAIGDFQAMQHQYAEAAIDIETARLLVYNAARLKDAGEPFVKQAAMAKLHASRVAERTASKCIEWLGGIGFTKYLLAEKFYRDAKIGAIYEGTSNMQLTTIAKIVKDEYKK
ncbi:hypothetical protein P43SY_001074 [Pythium insidiosum]|uniref:H(+)-exporting diphosphatase n=1 Tax=Pythium insidiosum TaxID=114742 RepID=A0AAD5LP02_PYTIN|nr:hypothetical protein P43SY_001074 [Pythium insidiosum]